MEVLIGAEAFKKAILERRVEIRASGEGPSLTDDLLQRRIRTRLRIGRTVSCLVRE